MILTKKSLIRNLCNAAHACHQHGIFFDVDYAGGDIYAINFYDQWDYLYSDSHPSCEAIYSFMLCDNFVEDRTLSFNDGGDVLTDDYIF